MPLQKRNIAVLISGSGSNLQALIDACSDESFPGKICLVISNKKDAYGLDRARKADIPTYVINHKDYDSRDAFDSALHQALKDANIEFVCLAGFMRLLTADFVNKWQNRMINIHPSLLPAFKGANAQRDALKAGVKISGCTVHFVVPEMDAGPIIIQETAPVLVDDTVETLAERILQKEHLAYPKALRMVLENTANQ